MLLDKLRFLHQLRIILASGSPRRKEILETIKLKFEVIPSTFPENLDKSKYTPIQYVIENARLKALDVYKGEVSKWKLSSDKKAKIDLVIGCDTVVVFRDQILEKPKTQKEAKQMLSQLSGSTHYVTSGVALIRPNDDSLEHPIVETFSQQTQVVFAPLTTQLIDAYVETMEPMDKAGGYGMQGIASQFVTKIDGCYFNVVGFPVQLFCEKLTTFLNLDDNVSDKEKEQKENI
ncbi:hypothetical protein RFI_14632 [Reticulomyxa filosa]|uniref:Uncharacterized protein n=1 Tax=Reticulomyxa filosa TaxID=46433 RepID=X6N9Y0_RETFI|nr:hypothetical protein RFI_14632 [Reticulomyxa filosa]|eukprot:ETO22559.1 hypothetical protein RFI_14632 [Reticulomyxa filosa]